MDRRTFMKALGVASVPLVVPATACRLLGKDNDVATRETAGGQDIAKLEKSKDEWKQILEPDRYRILFEEDTEPRGSSPLLEEKREGTYICAACFFPVFPSETKYESGTGWPSFYRPIEGHVETKRDFKLVLPRTEYHCARCGGHQGHVFDDGPPPTGKRYCNNGLALLFVAEGEDLPELRS